MDLGDLSGHLLAGLAGLPVIPSTLWAHLQCSDCLWEAVAASPVPLPRSISSNKTLTKTVSTDELYVFRYRLI